MRRGPGPLRSGLGVDTQERLASAFEQELPRVTPIRVGGTLTFVENQSFGNEFFAAWQATHLDRAHRQLLFGLWAKAPVITGGSKGDASAFTRDHSQIQRFRALEGRLL
jgi:hypothetical protein